MLAGSSRQLESGAALRLNGSFLYPDRPIER